MRPDAVLRVLVLVAMVVIMIIIIIIIILNFLLLVDVKLDVESGERVWTAVILGVLDGGFGVVDGVGAVVEVHLRVKASHEQLQGNALRIIRPGAEAQFAMVRVFVVVVFSTAGLVVGRWDPVNISISMNNCIHFISIFCHYRVL